MKYFAPRPERNQVIYESYTFSKGRVMPVRKKEDKAAALPLRIEKVPFVITVPGRERVTTHQI